MGQKSSSGKFDASQAPVKSEAQNSPFRPRCSPATLPKIPSTHRLASTCIREVKSSADRLPRNR